MFATLDEVQAHLAAAYSHPQFDLSELLLTSPGATDDAIAGAEARIGIPLPPEFMELVRRFDFSRLSIANVYFSYGDDLAAFVEMNLANWWGAGRRPGRRLVLASTDAHALFLDPDGHSVRALPLFGNIETAEVVSRGLEQFIRAAATLTLRNDKEGRKEIAKGLIADPELGADGQFWLKLARGGA